MSILDKYTITKKPPKLAVAKMRAGKDPMEKANKTFIAGLDKQLKQANAWKPGAKDARSWVTRDEANDRAWVTVKYGPWPVPIKGQTKTTLGPVKIADVPKVIEDIRQAHAAGELESALKKVAIRGTRKKGRGRTEGRHS